MIQNNPETRIHPVDHLVALLFVQVCITRAQAPKRDPRHVPIPPSPNVTDLLACLFFIFYFFFRICQSCQAKPGLLFGPKCTYICHIA